MIIDIIGKNFNDKNLFRSEFKRTLQLVEYARDEMHALIMFCSDNEQGDRKVALLEDISSLEEDISFLAITCEAVRYRAQVSCSAISL